jgi:hypothetical protein
MFWFHVSAFDELSYFIILSSQATALHEQCITSPHFMNFYLVNDPLSVHKIFSLPELILNLVELMIETQIYIYIFSLLEIITTQPQSLGMMSHTEWCLWHHSYFCSQLSLFQCSFTVSLIILEINLILLIM